MPIVVMKQHSPTEPTEEELHNPSAAFKKLWELDGNRLQPNHHVFAYPLPNFIVIYSRVVSHSFNSFSAFREQYALNMYRASRNPDGKSAFLPLPLLANCLTCLILT